MSSAVFPNFLFFRGNHRLFEVYLQSLGRGLQTYLSMRAAASSVAAAVVVLLLVSMHAKRMGECKQERAKDGCEKRVRASERARE